MGRRRKSEIEKRDKRLSVWVSAEESALVKAAAARVDESDSAFARKVTLKRARSVLAAGGSDD